jgi:hypothetical protein
MNANINLDQMDEDQLLLLWNEKKKNIDRLKAEELDLRKYIVSRAFPQKQEGTNTKPLGNGYALKAAVKYNYNLDPDNKKVEAALDNIAKIGNNGPFIAERLVSWKPSFLLTEYREVCTEAKEGSQVAKDILREIHSVLTITEAAPTLEIREPKAKR